MNNILFIPLTRGRNARIDEQDAQLVGKYHWHCIKGGYAVTSVGGRKSKKMIYMHRYIMGVTDRNISVDHVNKDKLDNTRSNLRICSHKENCRNSSKSKNKKTSIYKGVFFNEERKLWQANIKVNYKNIFLGRFSLEIDAARAYNDAAKRNFGEFASLNKL